MPPRRRQGYTLIEILIVLTIIALVSAAVLPAVMPALSGRQVSESARLVQAMIEGASDAAARANAPRGIRLLPDPGFPGGPAGANAPLAFSRIMPIETAENYEVGRAAVYRDGHPTATLAAYPGDPAGSAYPPGVLRIEESRYGPEGLPNERVAWWWNVRVGDRIEVGDLRSTYTVVGPLSARPPGENPEMFVNAGPPGAANPWARPHATLSGVVRAEVEYLFLVNGLDDDGDGYVDEGFDGVDNDADGATDEVDEWEQERWIGLQSLDLARDIPDTNYVVRRRLVPTRGSMVVELPSDVVIDASSWDSTRERSRVPVDPHTRTVDIVVYPGGRVAVAGLYSSVTAEDASRFFHLWLSGRGDVTAPAATGAVRLPLPEGAVPGAAAALKGDRRLITINKRNGDVRTTSMESYDPADADWAYREGQSGGVEAR